MFLSGGLLLHADSYWNSAGLFVFTSSAPEGSGTNYGYYNWNTSSNTYYSVNVIARAWEALVFSDQCRVELTDSCTNCSGVNGGNTVILPVVSGNIYYVARHKSKAFQNSTAIKSYTSNSGNDSTKSGWQGYAGLLCP